MSGHWFWWLIVAAVVVWYSSITIYVGIRGAIDIKHMLRRLGAQAEAEPEQDESKIGRRGGV